VTDTDFDRFITALDYPMFVLTVPASSHFGASGCLIGFATQCSISPPRFLACLSKTNHTFRCAAHVPVAAVHRLTAADRDLAELFGTTTGDEIDKFERCDWTPGPHGVPLLSRCSSWLAGTITDRVDLGDHQGLVLDVAHVGTGEATPSLMFSAVRDLDAGHPA
jgi:flavin reductase (DIM6/NTAB) family NADH-FMN oxidoreductase RutF